MSFDFDDSVESAPSSRLSSPTSSSILPISGGEKCPERITASRAMAITIPSSSGGSNSGSNFESDVSSSPFEVADKSAAANTMAFLRCVRNSSASAATACPTASSFEVEFTLANGGTSTRLGA